MQSPPLSAKALEEFHSAVIKLFYLTKRIRPEILPAITFLQKNPARGIVLTAAADLQIRSYIDASYAVYDNCRSQRGVVGTLGCGPVYAEFSKQKFVSKNSTETELIALSDSAHLDSRVYDLIRLSAKS